AVSLQGFFLARILFYQLSQLKQLIMKHLFSSLSFLLVFTMFTGCGINQNLQENAPAAFQQVYYTKDASAMKLYIPVSAIQTERVAFNSVYFKDRKADLELDTIRSGMYVATFPLGKPDLIMSSDPREEYGKKIPSVSVDAPFKIKDIETIIVFTERGDIKFYKMTGIEERTAQ